MESIQDIYERILKISWFENCGADIVNIDISYQQTKSRSEAIRKSRSSTWGNMELEARNLLTIDLHMNWRAEYRMWNDITDKAKELLKSGLIPNIAKCLESKELDISILQNVEWDILAAIMEHVYSPYVDPGFYTKLLRIYEMGYFPCGWIGKWPDGKLLIY